MLATTVFHGWSVCAKPKPPALVSCWLAAFVMAFALAIAVFVGVAEAYRHYSLGWTRLCLPVVIKRHQSGSSKRSSLYPRFEKQRVRRRRWSLIKLSRAVLWWYARIFSGS